MSASPKLSPERLQCPKELFGRADELAQLDAAWASDGQTRVVTIIAWGGVGKTALAAWWRSRLLATHSDVEAVLEWSFYSQGTQDRNAATAERFIHEALLFFDERALAESPAGQRVKATRLVEVIRERRVVLILDGLEPLQHPPDGAGLGALKEEGLAVLLRELARQSLGLCVVTSRERVRELEEFEQHGARCIELDRLDASAGSQLLGNVLEGEMRAVKPVRSSEAERREIVTVFEGHALSLLLIGSYVRRALGDVRRWREIDLREADLATQRGRVWRVMETYSTWLAGAGSEGQLQLAVLRMLGLFDRPADPGCIAALRREPAIPGLTDGLVGLSPERWRLVLTGLQEARLLGLAAYQAVAVFGYSELVAEAAGERGLPKGEPMRWPMPDYGSDADVLEAHPLVREYFGDELRRTNEAAWREGHRRLYEHLCDSVPHWPDGIEGLQPLFQAIVHGCAAGRVEESRAAVYRDRIQRGARAYSTHQLGALGAELGALANFFEHAWDRPARELSAGDRAWLLSEAAFDLRAVGRLSEALEPMRAGLDMFVELEHWTNAAIAAGNLSELELTLGRVAAAVADASMAVAHADRSGDEDQRMSKRTTLAEARLAAGELEQARALFEQAESMQAQHYPSMPELSSLAGHRFCDLLLLAAERAAWRASMQHEPPEPELVTLCETVSARATRALALAVRNRATLSIALDQLTLGRAALYAARLDAAPSLARAREHLDAALATLRKAGAQHHIPKGLLTRAWLHHLDGHDDLAREDLDEAWSIAERGPMPLIQADIHLHRARLFHDRNALAAADHLIKKHHYARRLPELEDAQLAAATWP